MAERAYFDWNATAPLREQARLAMNEALAVTGNASSVHAEGRAVRRLVEDRILIDGYDSLVDAEDLIRLREAKKVGAKIIGEKVITESGQKLGKVATATVRPRRNHCQQL